MDFNFKSETIDKAVEKLAEPMYNDLAKKTLQSTSNSFNTLINFFNNTVLYPMQKYNLYAQDKLENYALSLQNKTKTIPLENLVEPRVNILGPTLEGLKYNLDEEHIQEMFTNILTSEIDNRKQNRVLPSYIEIVKQLSSEDARFLKHLKINNLLPKMPITRLKLTDTTNYSYEHISDYIICFSDGRFMRTNPIVIDNLLRLQIIDIPFGKSLFGITHYEKTFDSLKSLPEFYKYSNIPDKRIEHQDSILYLTDFGKNFIDICLS